MSQAYVNYWKRKDLLSKSCPRFSVVPYWLSGEPTPMDKTIYNQMSKGGRVLDFGAGSLAIKKKFRDMGYEGHYETLDTSDEYNYDFKNLEEVQGTYDTILFLDVLEHLNLEPGLDLLVSLLEKLNSGGTLYLQTANARCVRNQKSTDMTHLHIYNLKDLWAYVTAMGFEAKGWRLYYRTLKPKFGTRVLSFLQKAFITKILDCDYADNILLEIRKPSP